tara:strand:- start:202 stop:630 length:429 start_codon:yes stop_codon:yes gene_type:complete
MLLYAYVEDGVVTYRGTLPKNWRNISGLNLSEGDDDYLKTLGWVPYVEVSVEIGVDETPDGEDTVITETKVTATAKKRAMTDDEKIGRDNSHALNAIYILEELETPQRLADALPDDSGGSADGRAWFKANRAKIAVERDKLA